MPKALKPIKCLEKFFESKVKENRDKWNAGLPNQFYEWEELQQDILNVQEFNSKLRKDNAELMLHNQRLQDENKKLEEYKNKYFELQKKYDALEREYNYLMNDSSDDEDNWEF